MNSTDKQDRDSLESALIRAIQETKDRIDSLQQLTAPIAPENSIGRISRMEAIGEKSINESSLRQARGLLSQLERALAHVHDDDFGYCDECGEEIPQGRLLLLPGTRHCVRCASLLE